MNIRATIFVCFTAGILLGALGAKLWSTPTFWKSTEPQKVVSQFLDLQSTAKYNEAKKLLSGESQILLASTPESSLTPDALSSKDLSVVFQNDDFARVSAHWVSQKEAMSQEFYLFKQQDGAWRIYSIQLQAADWVTPEFRATKVPQEAKATVNGYAHLLSSGDVNHAKLLLTGAARVRSTDIPTPNRAPAQTIEVVDIRGVAETKTGDVIAEVIQKVDGTTVSLLYTLTKLQDTWKISDLRLLSREGS